MKNEKNVAAGELTLNDLLEIVGDAVKAEKAPTPKNLRENAGEPVVKAMGGDCIAYPNGYAVYSNTAGTVVLWIPDCLSFTYKFAQLGAREKEYMDDRIRVGGDVLGEQPWFMAVMVRGDHQVEENSLNRKADRKGSNKNISLDHITEREEEEAGWHPGGRFENPERAFIKKEMLEMQLGRLTEMQREVFLLYHREGYTQSEIADILGISQPAVVHHLDSADRKVRNWKNLF